MPKQLQISIPDDMESQLEKIKNSRHETEEQIILNVLRSFLLNVSGDSIKELSAWDALSDEAWANFEKDYL